MQDVPTKKPSASGPPEPKKPSSPGLRERKKRATRNALAEAAVRLAAEHGVENVTVEAISEAAGVSPRTFFNYFPSHDDAFVLIDEAVGERIRESVRLAPADRPPLDVVREALTDELGGFEQRKEFWALQAKVFQRSPTSSSAASRPRWRTNGPWPPPSPTGSAPGPGPPTRPGIRGYSGRAPYGRRQPLPPTARRDRADRGTGRHRALVRPPRRSGTRGHLPGGVRPARPRTAAAPG